jgi:hypothetical protein
MECESTCTFPKENIKATGIMPGMFNDDLSFTFNAKNVHTTDPKEIDAMFAGLDAHVANYKAELRKHIAAHKKS